MMSQTQNKAVRNLCSDEEDDDHDHNADYEDDKDVDDDDDDDEEVGLKGVQWGGVGWGGSLLLSGS